MQVAIRLDRDLILDCRNGDLGAWQRLLDRYERLVFSVPRRYGLSREDAADITQLTFTILFQSMDTLSEDSTLGAWLTTVARRHTWRRLDRKRREEAGWYGNSMEKIPMLADAATECAIRRAHPWVGGSDGCGGRGAQYRCVRLGQRHRSSSSHSGTGHVVPIAPPKSAWTCGYGRRCDDGLPRAVSLLLIGRPWLCR